LTSITLRMASALLLLPSKYTSWCKCIANGQQQVRLRWIELQPQDHRQPPALTPHKVARQYPVTPSMIKSAPMPQLCELQHPVTIHIADTEADSDASDH